MNEHNTGCWSVVIFLVLVGLFACNWYYCWEEQFLGHGYTKQWCNELYEFFISIPNMMEKLLYTVRNA